MTAETTAHVTTPDFASATPVEDAVVRLTATDGLLLRSEHLDRMQDYALELSSGVGRGGGPGVDHGYGLTLRQDERMLDIGPGLARSVAGRPLILRRSCALELPAPGAAANGDSGVYVVWLAEASRPTGEIDQVLGDLCGDPCAADRNIHPYRAEGLRILVRQLQLGKYFVPPRQPAQLRSALAAAYFERERVRLGAALQGSLLNPASWSGGTGIPDADDAVPVGLVYSTGSGWAIDTWTARRDRVELPALRWWYDRLALRPEPVFLAQVLQFQAQLAETPPTGGSLAAAGFVELPPAGYLPVASARTVEEQLDVLFGDVVDVRVCSVPPGEVGSALEQARHLPRIPLTGSSDPAQRPRVDVLVPDGTLGRGAGRSRVRFARAGLKLTGASQAVAADSECLARAEAHEGGPVTFALAGVGVRAGAKARKDEQRAVWLDVRLSADPLAIGRGQECRVWVRFAGTPEGTAPRTGAELRVDLSATFVCNGRTPDGNGGVTLDGALSYGRYVRRSGGSVGDQPFTARPATIVVTRSAGQLEVQVTAASFEATATGPESSWPTSVAVQLDKMRLAIKLEEDPSAVLPGNEPRQAADKAIGILGNTELPVLAPDLLFAGAAPPEHATGHRTSHGWVFFTRRHQRDCGGESGDTSAVLMDLYTLRTDDAETILRDPELLEGRTDDCRYVTQLRWDGETVRLDRSSEVALGAWRTAEDDAAEPQGALVWFGRRRLPADFAVAQVIDRMRAGRTASPPVPIVVENGIPPLGLTPGSSGAVLVLLGPRKGE